MDTMGTVYTSLGLYDPAVRLVRKAYERRRNLWGERARRRSSSSLNHLGEVLTLKSDYAEAEQRLREALEISARRLFGESSAEVADTLTSARGGAVAQKGEYAQGEPLIREALEIRRKVCTARSHPDVARSIEDLGLNFYERGEYEQAVTYLREAVAMQQQLHKGAHPALAQAIDNLAFALMELGKPDEAEPLTPAGTVDEAPAVRRESPGDGDRAQQPRVRARGPWQARRGRGAPIARRWSINRQLLGAEPPDASRSTSATSPSSNTPRATRSQAIEMLRESLDMSRAGARARPSRTSAAARPSLAYWLIEAGQYEEAGPLVDEALAIRRKALGTGAPAGGGHAHGQGQPAARHAAATRRRANSRPRRNAYCCSACRRTPGRWLRR